MTVATFAQPNVTTQSAAVYKAAIDAAIAVLATTGADYACHAKSTPDMQVLVDAGQLFLANSTLVSNAQQTSATIVAPVTNPRIDRIVINDQTGVVSVITGSEAASPSAPAITAGTRPVAQILLATSTTAITNSMITDERVTVTFDVSTFIRTLLDDADAATARTTLGAAALAGLSSQDFSSNALTATGLITANGGQIQFPATQNASADANTLDDYEEGTWTPTLAFGGASVGMTFTERGGSYQKVGNRVTVNGRIQLSAKGSSVGSAALGGLPFTSASGANSDTPVPMKSNFSYTGTPLHRLYRLNASVNLEYVTEAGVTGSIADTNFVNNTQFDFSISYTV